MLYDNLFVKAISYGGSGRLILCRGPFIPEIVPASLVA
jgi:hypothetical protein